MQKIYSNIQGIKVNRFKQLQQFYEQNQPLDRLIKPEFAYRYCRLYSRTTATIYGCISCHIKGSS